MKKLYLLLILCACLCGLQATAQNWRPFRPNGDVHAFRGASADTILTLRLDSAGVSGADSVYYFNRIMRRATSFSWQKSPNNQFGQQMRYNVAQRTYVLLWNGGTSGPFVLDRWIVLKPFAPVGTTWTSLDIDIGMTTTLVSRGTALIDGVPDSIVTFRVGNPSGLNVVLSKNYGLVSAPRNLLVYSPRASMLTLARRPAPAGLSYYNPLMLLDLQPGDELGYEQEPIMMSSFPCYQGWLLRKVLARQVTNDSIIYTFRQQSKMAYSNAPGCPGLGTTVSPVTTVRLAASRRTGRWAGNLQAAYQVLPINTDLLAYEYRPQQPGTNSMMMGHPVVPTRAGGSCGGPALLQQEMLYGNPASGQYTYVPGIDAAGWKQLVAEGVGPVAQYEHTLTYSRRTINGVVQTCGVRTDFATLLPVKAARAAATFQLYPNPAAETATLTLPAPARASTAIRVLDNLGRAVLRQQLAIGQSTATLALQRLPGGLYIVEVQAAGEAPQQLRLQH
ncbi:T9SS type A sorting domain-containing protein [Hymenobacter psychrotolerans]|uniref:Por secretion system C-terminal sorting domain-containing protein n=1 Tax=Hymenobacter psychrotolerans DSM 18569 TaxID=1121959 RepID=A0A1M7CRY3_9BACT|nr:T9SS type A sorting domain-containing protein [Hymenobacter psychrotolerans]SHL70024.1 Por secretion system C-terminal sorting domain-containing protein [Hymenobacter psychrotolerans DSM 18569]